MKTVKFKRLYIKNFLSVGKKPVEIDFTNGVNLITGENLDVTDSRNAIGKSTILDAFNFAIFGNTLRKLTKDQIANNITREQTVVVLEFRCECPKGDNDFVITRTLGPSSLKVTKDGRDKTRDSIPNSTKYILEVLNASQEVFKNCILMRANNIVPFMAQSDSEKKKFIENLFNLDIITKMAKSVRDDINISKRELEVETKLLEQIETNLATYIAKRSNLQQQAKTSSDNYKKMLEVYNNDLRDIIADISKYSKQLSEIIDIKDEDISSLESEIKKISKLEDTSKQTSYIKLSKKQATQEALDHFNSLGGVCSNCKRPFSADEITKINEERQKLEDELEKLSIEYKSYNTKIKQLKKIKEEKEETLRSYHRQQSQYSNIEYKIASLQREKERTEKNRDEHINNGKLLTNIIDTSGLDDLISTASDQKKEKEKRRSEINYELSKLEISRYILSEEGIRSYIISKLLDLLNFRIKYYLSKMASQYSLEFNEHFEDTIKNKKMIPVSYGNLSGAEGKMLDLACTWAFRDILKLQGSVTYNIAFYDEILDSSMDAKNSEIVCNVLKEIAATEHQCTYLISHKNDFMKAVTGEIIKLQKKDGITIKLN